MDPAAALIEAIAQWRESAATPLVVAIDGRGATGKTTLAERAVAALGGALVRLDHFWRRTYAVHSSHPLAAYYDWERLRREVLEPLRAGRPARFLAADPDTGELRAREVQPADLIVIEGVSAASEALADLVDRTVLVQAPADVIERRLRASVAPGQWDEDWLAAERRYFATRPPATFDLVVSGAVGE